MSRKMLVVAPLRPCYLVWPKEQEEWENFKDLKVAVLHGAQKESLLQSGADVYVVNPEGLEWLLAKPQGSRTPRIVTILDNDTGAVLTVDEVTKFKHTKSSRHKLMRKLREYFARVWTLTGTPEPNGYLDLFGQIYVADGGATLGPYITKYRNDYFLPTGFGGYTWVLQDGAKEKIQKALRPTVLRVDPTDYVDIPEVLPLKVYVELPPHAMKIYKELERDMLAVMPSGETVTAMAAAAASIKCMQVANGGLYHGVSVDALLQRREPKKWEHLHDAKTDALEAIVEELGGKPVFVAYNFAHDLARIKERFGKALHVLGTGAGAAGLRNDAKLQDAWNAGDIALMAGHPASVGHGLNLQKGPCQDLVMYGDQWDYELYDQLLRRLRRQGSAHSFIRVHHLIAKDTVDHRLYASKASKGREQQELLDAMLPRQRKK